VTEKLKNPKIALATAAGAGLLILLAGWFLLVSPQRAKAIINTAAVTFSYPQVGLNKPRTIGASAEFKF